MNIGRAESRKKAKYISKRLGKDQFEKLQNEINMEYINKEVNDRVENFKKLFGECLQEAFKKNNISNIKANLLLDDVALIMQQKVVEKRNGKLKKGLLK